jgi:hypothetical protein
MCYCTKYLPKAWVISLTTFTCQCFVTYNWQTGAVKLMVLTFRGVKIEEEKEKGGWQKEKVERIRYKVGDYRWLVLWT